MVQENVQTKDKNLPNIRPAADIIQKNDSYYILIDMPGVNKEDLDISIDKKSLVVQGKTSYPKMEQEKVLENEFDDVRYLRQFTLSDIVDKDNIKANWQNGLLRLHLPKVKETEPKKIEIQSG